MLKEATVWAKDKRLSSLDKRYLDDYQKLSVLLGENGASKRVAVDILETFFTNSGTK